MEPAQIIQWVVIGVILAIVIVDKGRRIINRRNNSKNDGNPGYGERLATLEGEMKDVKEDVRLIKKKLNLI